MEALLAVALTCHLLLINLAMTGPLCCVWLDVRARRQADVSIQIVGVRLAQWAFAALILVLVSGGLLVCVLWLMGDQRLFLAARRIPGRISNGAWEVLFSVVCLGFYTWWAARHRPERRLLCWLQRLLAILAATNLMYHFPPLFTILWQLQREPLPATDLLDGAAFRAMMLTAEVLAFTFHYWLASLATSAMAVLLLAERTTDEYGTFHESLMIAGGRVALAASLLQIPTGVWLLSVLPSTQQTALLGNDLMATLLLVAALIATWFLLQQLAAVAWGDTQDGGTWRTMALLCCIVLLMSGTLVRSRRIGQPSSGQKLESTSQKHVRDNHYFPLATRAESRSISRRRSIGASSRDICG